MAQQQQHGASPAASAVQPAAVGTPNSAPSSAPPVMRGDGCRVKVAVRLRPFLAKEDDEEARSCARVVDSRQVVIGKDRAFTFDRLFSPDSTQEEVYTACVSPLISQFLCGINCTILAYGQTGAGKTHTMGTGDLSGIATESQGIVPRAIAVVFDHIERRSEAPEGPRITFKVKVSYIEIYNESLRDLLRPTDGKASLQIRDTSSGGIIVTGAHEEEVHSVGHMMDQLERGTLARSTGATMMNECSSRSHSILTIVLEQTVQSGERGAPESTVAKLHLVDLAGSERNKKTQAVGQRFKESVSINSGLLALGNVIGTLGDMSKSDKKTHVPYRTSKLTRLLQDSLGGNASTLMIACISPADTNIEESLNTLKYANRAKNIRNKPIVNRDPQSMLVSQLRAELQVYRKAMAAHGISVEGVPEGGEALPPAAASSASASAGGDASELAMAAEEVVRLRSERLALESELAQLRATQRGHSCYATLSSDAQIAAALLAAHSAASEGLAPNDAARQKLLTALATLEEALCRGGSAPQHGGGCSPRQKRLSGAPGAPLSRHQPNTPIERRGKQQQGAGGSPAGGGGGVASPRRLAGQQPLSDELKEMVPASMLLTGRLPASIVEEEPEPNKVISENQKLLRNMKRLEDDLFKSECLAVQETEERTKLQTAFTAAEVENQTLRQKNALLAKQVDQLKDKTQEETQTGISRLKDEISRMATDRGNLYEAKWRTELEKKRLERKGEIATRAFQKEHQGLQEQLKDLTSEIEQKTSLIDSLAGKERRMQELQQKNERTIQLMEAEKESLRQELDKALRKLEQSDHSADKLEKMKADLRREYEQRLRERDQRLQGLRKRQRESDLVIRQHDSDAQKITKLQSEVANMKKHQVELKNAMKSKSDLRESERDQWERQLMELQKQIRQLETENVRYSNTLRAKEEAVGRLNQQLNLEKSKSKQLAEKQAVMQREVVQKKSWLDKEIELQKRKRDAQERLQRELRRRERILKEREDNRDARDDMRRIKEQQDMSRLERGLQGWESQIFAITGKLEGARNDLAAQPESGPKRAETEAAVAALETQLLAAKEAHQEIHDAQAEAARLDNQLRQLDDRIDVLQATLEYGEDIIMQTETEIEQLSQADADMRGKRSPPSDPLAPAAAAAAGSPSVPQEGRTGGQRGRSGSSAALPSEAASDAGAAAAGPEGASSASQARGVKRPTHDQYERTIQQYAKKVLDMGNAEQEKELELADLRQQCEDKSKTIDKLKNALKLADMGFNRRLLRVQLEHERILSKLMLQQDQ